MTESRRLLRLANLDLNEINRVLSQIAERLDQAEGLRDTPLTFPVGATHITLSDTNPSSYLNGTWTQTGTDTLAGATVYLWQRTA